MPRMLSINIPPKKHKITFGHEYKETNRVNNYQTRVLIKIFYHFIRSSPKYENLFDTNRLLELRNDQ